jgi:uncharacterized protein YjbJ (UPF0337 family)
LAKRNSPPAERDGYNHPETRYSGMTDAELKGKWGQVKGKLKQKYGQLTDNDLTFAEGKSDELFGRVAEKLGRKKEEIRAEIERL